MPAFDELRFPSADKRLQLYTRIYPGDGPAILMLHGLTRNSADFEDLASHLAGRFRLVVADQRGRGLSEYDPEPTNYLPVNYSADMLGLIDQLGLERPILIGTSMGGLVAMIMATMRTDGFRGLVLNDVGPVVEQTGLDRIASYVGAVQRIGNWEDAAEYCRCANDYAFPDYGDAQWQAFARRLFRSNANGVPELAYDPAIAAGLAPSNPSAVPPNLWPIWKGLANVPVLAVRGALSDILSEDTLGRMGDHHPDMRSIAVAGVGHAPMLDEPDARLAIDQFVGQFSGSIAGGAQ
jgi:pimeloyl-ACP methyl ester carboxylesterase